jgi:thioredoxin-like negative regulator of GroEL
MNEKDYKSQLKGICCVEISGESCANCLTLMPILDRLCGERDDVRLVHVEADYSTMALMEEWEVDRVPTILLTDDGEIFARCKGFQPEEILEIWLDAKLAEHKAAK